MTKLKTAHYWIIWVATSLLAAGALGYTLTRADDKSLFMPGPMSNGHHQLIDRCDACHTDAFGGGEVLQEQCIACHGDVRVKPFDSHPRSKFTDPRNADRLEKVNALACITCHTEHRPEITLANGLTQPVDICYHCHAEIGDNRPSHREMTFDSCTNAGCHNFHNNRALYTDFLVKHMDDPPHAQRAVLPAREFADVLDEILEYPRDLYPVEPLTVERADAPAMADVDPTIIDDWARTAHAASGVNCSACHQPTDAEGKTGDWQNRPGINGCQACHAIEIERFGLGKHGMRIAAGLSPMQPAMARLPMREDTGHESLDCNSCHPGHRFDTGHAAVDACLQCHADEHSLAYEGSPHHELWRKEIEGSGKPGSGVSCASCHMPRVDHDVSDWLSRKIVDHNQSASLAPNSKMIRPACLHCHGLGFAIDALADRELIDNNFRGEPQTQVESIALARADQERYLQEKADARTSN